MNLKYKYLIFFLLTLFIASCNDDDSEEILVEERNEFLDSFEVVGTSQASLISTFIAFSDFADLASASISFEYDVQHYTVIYRTMYRGEEILASGVVSFPVTEEPMPMLSFQNGTNTDDAAAPSSDLLTSTTISAIASAGYIFVLPDYIGFGASFDIVPPYHHAEYSARAVIDLLKATKELARNEGFNFNEEVFLAGYSEGGYASMASHKLIEEEKPEGLSLVASAPASGGYDVKGFQEYLFAQETYNDPFYLAFVALSYKEAYGYDDPLSDLFQEPYASNIPLLFDGTRNGSSINNELTTVMADLLQPAILENIDTDPRYTDFVNALNENSLVNWQPQAPMYMFHGTDDITVPYQNSIDTYNQLVVNGASNELIIFTDLEGHTHASGVLPYIVATLDLFENLK